MAKLKICPECGKHGNREKIRVCPLCTEIICKDCQGDHLLSYHDDPQNIEDEQWNELEDASPQVSRNTL